MNSIQVYMEGKHYTSYANGNSNILDKIIKAEFLNKGWESIEEWLVDVCAIPLLGLDLDEGCVYYFRELEE